jgi:hypothetical protein
LDVGVVDVRSVKKVDNFSYIFRYLHVFVLLKFQLIIKYHVI